MKLVAVVSSLLNKNNAGIWWCCLPHSALTLSRKITHIGVLSFQLHVKLSLFHTK